VIPREGVERLGPLAAGAAGEGIVIPREGVESLLGGYSICEHHLKCDPERGS